MEGSRDGVCLYYTKALVREAAVLSWRIIESIVVLSLSASEISRDEEDGGKSWSREGQKEEVFRK